MKYAASNIGLSAYDHTAELYGVAEMGVAGLEVAPSRVWRDDWQGLTAAQVAAYRKAVEAASLRVVGLHSLFFIHPELGLFKDAETRRQTMEFMVHLSGLCCDLGGRTLIYGGGRNRGSVPPEEADEIAVTFMAELCRRTSGHGTVFCFEPLGPKDSDYINSVFDALAIVERVNHPGLRMQIDAKALVDNNELAAATFAAASPYLVHVHANEPGLGVLGSSGAVDHGAIGAHLKDIDYKGYVSVEQRMLNEQNPLSDLAESVRVLKECYK